MSENPLAAVATLAAPNQDEILRPAQAALEMVKEYQITDDESYGLAAEELKAIKAKAKALEEKRTAITGPLNAALKAVNALFKPPADALEQAERLVKGKMIGYTEEQERKVREAQLAAEKVAREAEQKAAAEAAARAQAGAHEAQDDVAQHALEASVSAAAAVAYIAPAPKVSGISKVRETTKVRITDKAAFLAHIAQVPAYADLVDVNETKLNALAKALGAGFSIPGAETYTEKTIAARAA